MSPQRAANNTNTIANAMMDPCFFFFIVRLRNHQVGYYNDAHVAPDRTLPHLKYNYVMGDVSACGGGGGSGRRTRRRRRALGREHLDHRAAESFPSTQTRRSRLRTGGCSRSPLSLLNIAAPRKRGRERNPAAANRAEKECPSGRQALRVGRKGEGE